LRRPRHLLPSFNVVKGPRPKTSYVICHVCAADRAPTDHAAPSGVSGPAEASAALILLAAFLALAAIAGWGYLSIGSARAPMPAADRAILALPAGLLMTAVASFVLIWPLGLHLNQWTVLGPAVGLALLALVAAWKGPLKTAVGGTLHLPPGGFDRILLGLATIVGLLFFGRLALITLHIPIEGYDFYLYHWHFARVLYESGAFPSNVSPSYFEYQYASPPLAFLLYAQISVLVGELSQLGPRLLPLLSAAGIAVVAWRMARVHLRLSPAAALVSGAFGLYGGYYAYGLVQENTDTVSTLFSFAGMYWLWRRDLSPLSRILGGGLLLAGGYWGRYDGLGAIGVASGVVCLTAILERIRGRPARAELAVGIGGLLLAMLWIAPHLARNVVLFGNPLYPAFGQLIGGHLIDPWTWANTLQNSSAVPFFGLPSGWWLHPLAAFPETGPAIAIVLVAAVPAVVLARRGDSAPLQLVLAALGWAVISLFLLRVPDDGDRERHLLLLVALAAPLLGLIVERLLRWSRTAVFCLLALAALLGWYALIDHDPKFEAPALMLIPLLGIVAWRSWRLHDYTVAHSMPRLELAMLLLWPFLLLTVNTLGRPIGIGPFGSVGLATFPEAQFLSNLPAPVRYLTFEDRVEMLRGEVLPGDHPSLEEFYASRLDGAAAVAALKSLGVRYIYWYTPSAEHPQDPPLMSASPLFAQLDDPALFRRIYVNDQGESTVTIYELR
jgi:hypothetical protein